MDKDDPGLHGAQCSPCVSSLLLCFPRGYETRSTLRTIKDQELEHPTDPTAALREVELSSFWDVQSLLMTPDVPLSPMTTN